MIDKDAPLESLIGLPLIPAPNLSKGFHQVLLGMLMKWAPSKKALLIAENPEVVPAVKGAVGDDWQLDCLGYKGLVGESYEVDLNVLQDFPTTYPAVMSQALLEHVSRPSVAIENMIRMVDPGGVVILHTVNPGCGYHAFPIDCVRFFPDFWRDLAQYIPYELLWFREDVLNHFVAMRRTE